MFLPHGRRFLFVGGHAGTAPKRAIHLASLDSQTRTRLLDVHSQPDYAPGFLLYQRGGAVMAHPFDEKQGRLTGDAVAIAEGVDTDAINGRATFSVSANGALIYRSGPATGGSGRLTWFDRSGKTLGTVAEIRFLPLPARVTGRPARGGDVQQGRGRDGSVADRSRSRRSDPVHVPPGR